MPSRITLAIVLTALSTAAIAQTAEEQKACMDDAFRVCSATIPDRARTTACMVQNKSLLSARCQMVMDKHAPATTAPVETATATPARTGATAPVKTAGDAVRPGKPLNILAR